ncbi:hypothetical protein SAMN06265365_1413 [Tistlia consotensis]|uniref:Transcriptional regulator-like domain-containing protein n=1 Tax=Tistlia consotensis USBA 355 TaxID=560819 RepID=A0A1Y6CQ90_9PROT|nr:hypothetical protein SAMN05428998_14441 [Tistlia consotensis USBA 355]SNS23843.1 hypothetical protein SAMN06265365_1413 [Tistlia consotensis]
MSKEKTVPGISPRADWRDPECYKSLVDLDRAGWAWEWLKRNPDFATAAGRLPQVSPPLPPSAAERRLKAAQPRILRIQNPGPFEQWGVFFHHCRYPADYGRLLAAAFQSVCARRGSAADCTRPHRRLRHPMLCVNDDRVVLRRIRARAFQRWLAPSPTDGDGGQCSRRSGVPPLPAVGSPAYGGEGSGAATAVWTLPPRPSAARPLSTGAPGQSVGDDAARLGRRNGGREPAAGGSGDLRGDGGARALGVRLPLPHATACPRGRGDGERRLPETSGAGNRGKGRLLTDEGLKPARESRPARNP